MGCGCNKKKKATKGSTRKRKLVTGNSKPKVRIRGIIRTKPKTKK
jgi:hypothetical protein